MPGQTEPMYVKLCMTIHNNATDMADLRSAAVLLRENHFWGIEPDIRDPLEIDVHQLASIVSDNGLTISALATGRGYGLDGLSLSSPDTKNRLKAIERIRAHIDLACELKTNVIIGLMRGIRNEADPPETCKQRLIDSLVTCGNYAANNGCLIFFEAINHKETNLANSAVEAAGFVKAAGKAVKLLLDTYHMDLEESSISETIETHIDILGHFHLADRDRSVPGTAGIDFVDAITTLGALGYKNAVCVEIPLVPDAQSCIGMTRQYLNNLGIYSICQK